MGDDLRLRFAIGEPTGRYGGIDVANLDVNDEDDRAILIEAEHTEFHDVLRSGQTSVRVGQRHVNPAAHLALHAVVANQLIANNPPEMWTTARRLILARYERHEILHMLASVVSSEIYGVLAEARPFDIERTRSQLEALPGSWDAARTDSKPSPDNEAMNRAQRRATARHRRR